MPYEIDHHFKTLVRVVDHDVLLADRGEAVSIVFTNAFGVSRVIGFELQIAPVRCNDFTESAHPDDGICLHHRRAGHAQLLKQHLLGDRIEIFFQFKLDHAASTAALDRAAECADQIFGFFLNFDIAVSQNAKQAIALDFETGKDEIGKPANEARD